MRDAIVHWRGEDGESRWRWRRWWVWVLRVLGVLLVVGMVGCGIMPQWCPSVTELPGGRVEIPLEISRGAAYVRAADAQGEYLIEMDTGCRDLMLLPRLAEALHTREHLVFPSISTDASGIVRWSWTAARVERFGLGPAWFESVDADVVDFSHLFAGMDPPVAAIAGLNLFHDCLVTLDFPGRRLILERGALPAANGRDILAYRWGMKGNLEVPVRVGEQEWWGKLDTGFGGQLSLSEERARALKFDAATETRIAMASLFGERTERTANLVGDLVVGQYRFERPRTHIAGQKERILIGAEYLFAFQMTLDQRNRRVRLTRPGEEKAGGVIDKSKAPATNQAAVTERK